MSPVAARHTHEPPSGTVAQVTVDGCAAWLNVATPGRTEHPAGKRALLETLTFCSRALWSSLAAAAKHSAASGMACAHGVASRTRRWSNFLIMRVPHGHSIKPDHLAPFHAFCLRGSGHSSPHRSPEPSGFRVFICIGLKANSVGDSSATPKPLANAW
eukprot:scaffold108783_cov84-Phaeocystis_antarctica.AAC.4